jgi:hypothetical protein
MSIAYLADILFYMQREFEVLNLESLTYSPQ